MYQHQSSDEMNVCLQEFPAIAILDEVQRMPDLFAVLRGVIDQRCRAGAVSGRFLLLGSARMKLLPQHCM